MKILNLILEVSNLLDMMYESHDDRGLPPVERRAQKYFMIVGGRQHPIIAVIAEFVWRQLTSSSGGRHKDSLLG